ISARSILMPLRLHGFADFANHQLPDLGLVMRKGYRREAGSEGSAKQRCEPMDKNRIRGASAGRAGNVSRSPYPSTARSVDPAVVHRRRLSLPRETCPVSPYGD